MLERRVTIRTTGLAAALLGAVVLAGCAQTRDFMAGLGRSSAEPADGDSGILGAPDADAYLAELYELAAGDPATQAEIFADARSESTLTPAPQTHLRYALVLATPGHAEFDPEQAQSLLRETLAQTELLTRAEIALATIHLQSVEEFIVMSAETRRLRATTSRAAQTQEAAAAARLANVEADNRRLRRELEEALEKLDALTSIERSIREQGDR